MLALREHRALSADPVQRQRMLEISRGLSDRETRAIPSGVHNSSPAQVTPTSRGEPTTGRKLKILYDAGKCTVALDSISLTSTNTERLSRYNAKFEHIVFIQTLCFIDKKSKEEITRLTLDSFPQLCKGEGDGTEAARTSLVRTIVERETCMWAAMRINI